MIIGVLLQFIAGWPGELACRQKAFKRTIPDYWWWLSLRIQIVLHDNAHVRGWNEMVSMQ